MYLIRKPSQCRQEKRIRIRLLFGIQVLDVGFFEIIIVALACLLIVGPERLPVVFRTLGVLIGRAQNYVSKVKSDVEKEINLSDYKSAEEDFKDLGKQYGEELSSLENEIRNLSSNIDGINNEVAEEKKICFHINSPRLSWREENFQLKVREKVRSRLKRRRSKKLKHYE